MIMIFAVYDKVAKVHTAPLAFENKACASRWFKTAVKKYENPDDYVLYQLADYDTKTGELIVAVKDKNILVRGEKFRVTDETIESEVQEDE